MIEIEASSDDCMQWLDDECKMQCYAEVGKMSGDCGRQHQRWKEEIWDTSASDAVGKKERRRKRDRTVLRLSEQQRREERGAAAAERSCSLLEQTSNRARTLLICDLESDPPTLA